MYRARHAFNHIFPLFNEKHYTSSDKSLKRLLLVKEIFKQEICASIKLLIGGLMPGITGQKQPLTGSTKLTASESLTAGNFVRFACGFCPVNADCYDFALYVAKVSSILIYATTVLFFRVR